MVSPATADVPSTIDGVTPEWLTSALGCSVSETRIERIAEDSGFSSLLYRVHLIGSAELPASVIVKLPAESEARGAMELLGGYRRELAFYRHVAHSAPMETPYVHAARMIEATADFVLVLEDLAGWDNADHLAGLSMRRARLCIRALAGLHSWSADPANSAVVGHFPSIDTPIARDLLVPAFEPGWQVYLEHARTPVPSAVSEFAQRFANHAGRALQVLAERSMLLHGDIRADNLFFDGDRLKVVDFQFAAVGSGAADIAYLVSQGLPSAVRRGHDEALVREYLTELSAHGVDDYSFDEAWRHYRFGVAYLMVLPVITLNGWDAMPERSRALCLKLTERAVATIDEVDALEVFA
jgi:aminoglycoside phosphotransferase (APT) family kinase protein